MPAIQRTSPAEILEVVDQWLAEKVGLAVDDLGPHGYLAAEYARFLAEMVDITISANPIVVTETALRLWREKTSRG